MKVLIIIIFLSLNHFQKQYIFIKNHFFLRINLGNYTETLP